MVDQPSSEILSIFIGYDEREADAYAVCRRSLIRRSESPLHIQPLVLSSLQSSGLYRRTWREENGQRIDQLDGRPFSTDFAFTRFLVPSLTQYRGWAMFVDCDFVFLDDVTQLFAQRDPSKAVMVCQQTHKPAEGVKMDGQIQTTYPRKNWSSLILWNCEHPANRLLTVDAVNCEPGSWLHRFGWLRDEEIGDLPHQWNWIDGVTEGEPKAVHYTLGGPWFQHCQNVAYADRWNREFLLERHYHPPQLHRRLA